MRLIKTLGLAGVAALGVAALLIGSAARGQQDVPTTVIVKPPAGALGGAAPGRFLVVGNPGAGTMNSTFEASDGLVQVELSRRAEALVSQYGETSEDAQRQKIKTDLSEILAEQFNLQQKIREDEVTQIEARVKKLRELIEKRKAAQKSIIENRLEQLLRDAEGLGWAPPAESRRQALGARNYPLIGVAAPVQLPAPGAAR